MRCIACGSETITERPERTAQGYRRVRCRSCGRQWNERTGTVLNWTQYPSGVIANMKAARAFFRSAKIVTGITSDRVTTDGHDSSPRAIRTELGKQVRHWTSRYLNSRLEQDHRGLKGR
jgi:transcriptional regulator NrdR family protein